MRRSLICREASAADLRDGCHVILAGGLGPHVRGRITLLLRRICALCPAWVVDDG